MPRKQPAAASADDPPPGVKIAAKDGFAPSQGLGAFQAMTFVIAGFPAHSHPGRSQVMVIKALTKFYHTAGLMRLHPEGRPSIIPIKSPTVESPAMRGPHRLMHLPGSGRRLPFAETRVERNAARPHGGEHEESAGDCEVLLEVD
jgi:hypothetical protein